MYGVVYRGEELDYLLRDFLLKLEKEIADAAAAKEAISKEERASAETKVYDASSFVDYLADESKEPAGKSFKDSGTMFSVEIDD